MRQTLFISYSWGDSKIADQIDIAFQPTGLFIKRDVREIEYKGNIKEYMEQIRKTDYSLLIISDSFLKSANCMYEVLEFIKDINYKDKILPIIVDGTKIFKADDRLEYIKYWGQKHSELNEKLKEVNTTDTLELYKDLKHIENIRSSIDEFMGYLAGINCHTISLLQKQNYRPLFKHIGVSDRLLIDRILAVGEISDIQEKEIELDKMETEYPNNAKVYFTKASSSFDQGQTTKSTYFYRKSLTLDPEFGSTYYNLAFNVENFENNHVEAKELYEKSIELDKNNTKAYSNLAGIYSRHLKDYTKAKELLENAVSINPFDSISHFNLAALLHREYKDVEKAKSHYETALQINPEFTDAKHNYGMLLWHELKEYALAKDQFIDALEINPLLKNTLNQLAQLLEEIYKHYDTAKIYYDRSILIEPNSANDHFLYSSFLALYFRSDFKEKAKAKFHYDLACEMDGSFKSPHMDLLLT